MVTPGILPLAIIRGIKFPSRVLLCRDESVVVTGTLNPDVTGTYVPSGTFSGYPLFILAGAPSTFLYFNAADASYVIARILTTGALTDYWLPSSPLIEPTGDYVGQGSNTGTASATDHPVDLTGYDVAATVRRSEKAEVYIDLNPSITNAATGEITIPAISSGTTEALEFIGDFMWDLVLTQNAGVDRFGPYIKGPFVVSDNITQPPNP